MERKMGGKIVNHGVITLNQRVYTLTFEYPVTMDVEVTCGDLSFTILEGTTTNSNSLAPGEELGETIEFWPSNEDDTYIYEVAINI